ncbi:MAG: chemotaxis protein CheD [Candidatus Omnitrophota bacterium]
MKFIIDVQTGEVKVGRRRVILESRAIGSCIAVIAFDALNMIGGLAHIMLPGKPAFDYVSKKSKYAAHALDELIFRMGKLGTRKDNIETCLLGAGNVLERTDDTICSANINSVTTLLREHAIRIQAQSLGGTQRRSVSFDVGSGNVFYSQGNSRHQFFYSFTQ